MADEIIEQQPADEKKTNNETEIASAGAPQRSAFNPLNIEEATEPEQTSEEIPEQEQKTETAAETAKEVPSTEKVADLSDEELTALYLKRFPTKVEQTEAEKTQSQKVLDKQMLDIFIESGMGTAADFVSIQNVAKMDLKELSKKEVIDSMKEAKFSDEEITEILAERYYQINPEELEQTSFETDEEFEERKARLQRKVAFGTAKLEGRGKKIQGEAELILNTLKESIEKGNALAEEEATFTANVDKLLTTLPRKITSELGKLNNEDLGSVSMEVAESDIAEVVSTLKDSVKRKQILFNENGSINEQRIGELLLKEKLFDKGSREGFLAGRTNQTEFFERLYPNRTPNSIGVGGTSSSISGGGTKIASAGRPQRQPQGARPA